MDHANLFATPTTYRLMRLEYGVGLVVCVVLAALHLGDINWIAFIALFLYIDLIGYLPGALAYRRSEDGRIGRVYYVLYNIGHSVITGAALAGLYALAFGPEWALLAIPIHLCGDRALFGNFPKAFSVAFEPEPHPVYEQVRDQLAVPMTSDASPARAAAAAGAAR